MPPSTGPRLIHLLGVSKSYPGSGELRNVVLRPTTLSIPIDRKVAILGAKRAGKTTMLQLLGRKLEPDQGDILGRAGLSPIVNCGGFLNPQLSGLENIRFLARAYGFEPDLMVQAVDALCGISFPLGSLIKAQDAVNRKILEAAIIIVLPFECYLFDEIGQLPPPMIDRCMEAASRRNAGFIFASSQPRLVRQLADWVVVIDDATLYAFTRAKDAIEFFEQKGRHERH
jgi:capsular polysaccharide transport system ATP-binding protein